MARPPAHIVKERVSDLSLFCGEAYGLSEEAVDPRTLNIDAVPATLQALQSVVRKQLLDANPDRNFDSAEARERTQACLRARRYLTKLINGGRGVNRAETLTAASNIQAN